MSSLNQTSNNNGSIIEPLITFCLSQLLRQAKGGLWQGKCDRSSPN